MKLLTESLWADEAFSALIMKMPLKEINRILFSDVHPPFYYYLGALWGKLFGFSEVSLRSLSLLFLLGTSYISYLLVKRISKDKFASILASLMVLLVPFVNYYGFEARMYTLLTFLSLLSIYYFLGKRKKLLVFTNTFLIYTHYFGVFVIVAESFLELFESFKKKNFKEAVKKQIPYLITLLLYSPWLVTLLKQTQRVGETYWLSSPDSGEIVRVFTHLLSGGLPNTYQLAGAIVVILLLAVVNWKKVDRDVYRLIFIFLFAPVVSLLISLISTPIFFERYLITFTVGVILILNITTIRLLRPILLLILFVFGYFSFNTLTQGSRQGIREAVIFAKQNMNEDDLMITYGDISNHIFESRYYGLKTPLYSVNTLPSYMGIGLIEEGDIIDKAPSVKGNLLILTDYYPEFIYIPGYKMGNYKDFNGVNIVWAKYDKNNNLR